MKNVFTNEEAIVNFIFFLSNHNGMNNALDGAFGENSHIANHFKKKLSGIMNGSYGCMPEHIIKLLGEMSTGNKQIFAKWVNENYDSGIKKRG